MITITGLDDFPAQLQVFPFPLTDGRSILACVHQTTPGTDEVAYSAVYLVDSPGRAVKLGQSEPFGKDIDCSLLVRALTLELWVTEPPPGGGGADSAVHVYSFTLPVPVVVLGLDQYARNRADQALVGVANHEARLIKIAAGAAG